MLIAARSSHAFLVAAHGITDKRKVFHSFRHTFVDALGSAGLAKVSAGLSRSFTTDAFAPVPINVRCYSNGDMIVRRSEGTLRASFRDWRWHHIRTSPSLPCHLGHASIPRRTG